VVRFDRKLAIIIVNFYVVVEIVSIAKYEVLFELVGSILFINSDPWVV